MRIKYLKAAVCIFPFMLFAGSSYANYNFKVKYKNSTKVVAGEASYLKITHAGKAQDVPQNSFSTLVAWTVKDSHDHTDDVIISRYVNGEKTCTNNYTITTTCEKHKGDSCAKNQYITLNQSVDNSCPLVASNVKFNVPIEATSEPLNITFSSP